MVVVSALGSHPTSPVKVTDLLLNMVARATNQDTGYGEDLDKIKGKHVEAASKLLGAGSPEYTTFINKLESDCVKLLSLLSAIAIAGKEGEPGPFWALCWSESKSAPAHCSALPR